MRHSVKVKNAIIFIPMLFLTACFGLWDSSTDTIIDNYQVVWIDVWENQFICEEDESYSSCKVLVEEYVFAVGHNDDYIIAKQHPTNGFEGGYKVDTTVTNFYIIDIKQRHKNGSKVTGPLTEEKFNRLRNVLRMSTIEFDQTYPEKP